MPTQIKFFNDQLSCELAHPQGKIFLKIGNTEFFAFDRHCNFLGWYEKYIKICEQKNKPVKTYEVVKKHLTNCFFADIEVYSKDEFTPIIIEKVQTSIITTIEDGIRELYPKSTGAGCWTENHRKSTKYGGVFKFSMHVTMNDILFNDVSRFGRMHSLAKDLNEVARENLKMMLSEEIPSLIFPDGDLLDMGVYHVNRAMRCKGATKEAGDRPFTPVGKVHPLKDYMITKDVNILEIKEEFLCNYPPIDKDAVTRSAQKKRHREEYVANGSRPDTEMVSDIKKHLETWGDTTSRITQKDSTSFEVRGHKRVCPKCTEGENYLVHEGVRRVVHDGNGAYIYSQGSGNYIYHCLHPHAPGDKKYSFYVPGNGEKVIKEEDDFPFECVDMDTDPTAETEDHINKKQKTQEDYDRRMEIAIQKCKVYEEERRLERKKYLPSLVEKTKKCLVVCAPMGSGKTHAVGEFYKSFSWKPSVIYIVPRIAMGSAIQGRFVEFCVYTDKMDQKYQIIEYESLHRLMRAYDIVILDEIRSLVKSMVSTVTNKHHYLENLDLLKGLCRNSKHTILLDADIHFDGAVKTFIDDVFGPDDVEYVNHTGGAMTRHHRFMGEKMLKEQMKKDLENGKRIMVCHGSVKRLRELGEWAGDIIDGDKIGLYYSESDLQDDLVDVNTNCEKYQMIGFTSTITVSVSFDTPFHRVYVLPSQCSFTPREALQMEARARNLVTQEVVVLMPSSAKTFSPLEKDMPDEYERELKGLIEKRSVSVKVGESMGAYFLSAITKRPCGDKMMLDPHLFVKLTAWDRVEEKFKFSQWFNHYLKLLLNKNLTYEFVEDVEEEEGDAMDEEEKEFLTDEERLDKFDILEVSPKLIERLNKLKYDELSEKAKDLMQKYKQQEKQLKELYKAKKNGELTGMGRDYLRKYEVQKEVGVSLSGKDTIEFEKNREAITNFILMSRVPEIFRNKIRVNSTEMGLIPEIDRGNGQILTLLEDALDAIGVFDLKTHEAIIPPNVNTRALESFLTKIDKIYMGRKSRTDNPISILSNYLKKIMGYKLTGKRSWDKKEKKNVTKFFVVEPMYDHWIDMHTKIGSDKWLREQFFKFDMFKGIPLGSDYRFTKARNVLRKGCVAHQIRKHGQQCRITSFLSRFAYKP